MKVDLQWPADQQLLLGLMPFYVFREEVKEAISAIIGPGKIHHLYLQNVPKSGQIWGQVAFVNKSVTMLSCGTTLKLAIILQFSNLNNSISGNFR